jgi:hypothetical protein
MEYIHVYMKKIEWTKLEKDESINYEAYSWVGRVATVVAIIALGVWYGLLESTCFKF